MKGEVRVHKYHSTFEGIKLEDTGLMKKSNKDPVYNRLSKSGITNLKELFELDDLQGINYGNTSSFFNVIAHMQARGVVKLLRTRYLGEFYPYLHVLENTVSKIEQAPKSCNEVSNVTMIISKLGLHRDFAYSMSTSKKANRNAKVIEELERVYLGELPIITSTPNFEINKRRIGIILEWYYRTIYCISLDETYIGITIEKLKQQALLLKDVPEKRYEYILVKIKLDREIFSMERILAQKQSYINQIKL